LAPGLASPKLTGDAGENGMRVARLGRRLRIAFSAAALATAAAGAALAAIAPWHPREGEDTCKVLTNAEPKVETPPPPWQVAITRPRGWVGQDPRIYFVPPVLDCRGDTAHRKTLWACTPTFIPWAKRNCTGLEIRE
jgi:hypothetical protein